MGSGQSSCPLPETEAGGSVAKLSQGLGSAVTNTFGQLQGELLRQTRSYKEIANLSYQEFLDYVTDINEISSQFLDANGKQLVFAVKKGSDTSAIWKGTVRVACCKVDASTKYVDSYRLLTLKQFLAIFKSLQTQTAALQRDSPCSSDSSNPATPSLSAAERKKSHPLTLAKFSASTFLDEALEGTSVEECCICIERRPDLILPCLHSYCLPCIEQWNVNNKTCPVCRETVASTDEGWVISDGPDCQDIATQIQKSLMEIADD